LWFAFARAINTGVPFGTGMDVSVLPSVAAIGVPSGRMDGAIVSRWTAGTGGYLWTDERNRHMSSLADSK
jgi:hypothetical protein